MEIDWRDIAVGLFGVGSFTLGFLLGKVKEESERVWPTPYPRHDDNRKTRGLLLK